MRNLLLPPMMRQGTMPSASTKPWYRISNKAKSKNVTKVYIYDAIGGWFGVEVNEFIKELNDIETDEIHLHINSPGGSVYDGIAIYNALKQHDAKVTTYVDALAASAASFIALAGEEVIVARNATMMIHDAIGACYGNMQDMEDTADILDKVSDNIADIYAYNTGGDKAEWRALMKAETWYNASEAVEAGLADSMLDEDEVDEEADTENKWDLSKFFNYGGREKAPSPEELRMKVSNQLKEASMARSGPKNTEGTPEGTPTGTPGEPEAAPEAAPAGTEEEQGTETAPEAGAGEPSNQASFSVLVNGSATANVQAVQQHINMLETFRNETIETSRIEFVEGLSRANKIAATQVGERPGDNQAPTGLIAFALGLSDEQFSSWKATFDAAQPMSMFDPHGTQLGNEGRPANGGEVDDVQAEIETLEEVVMAHKRGGMTQEQIESKVSWKRLQALKSQTTPTK